MYSGIEYDLTSLIRDMRKLSKVCLLLVSSTTLYQQLDVKPTSNIRHQFTYYRFREQKILFSTGGTFNQVIFNSKVSIEISFENGLAISARISESLWVSLSTTQATFSYQVQGETETQLKSKSLNEMMGQGCKKTYVTKRIKTFIVTSNTQNAPKIYGVSCAIICVKKNIGKLLPSC